MNDLLKEIKEANVSILRESVFEGLEVLYENNGYIVICVKNAQSPFTGCITCNVNASYKIAKLADLGLKVVWHGFYDKICRLPVSHNVIGLVVKELYPWLASLEEIQEYYKNNSWEKLVEVYKAYLK